MPPPIQALNSTATRQGSHHFPSALRRRDQSNILTQLENRQRLQQVQANLPVDFPIRSALRWLRAGLGGIGNTIADTLGYLFGPLFWFAFEAQLRQAARDYEAQREQSQSRSRETPELHN